MKKQKVIKKNIYRYVAVFEPDAAQGGYTVTIPALPGCISEGDTFEEALRNIQEAAELYLEVMAGRTEKNFFRQQADAIIAPVQLAF